MSGPTFRSALTELAELANTVADTLGPDSAVFAGLDTLFAPLTEEPAKFWLLLVPWFLRRLRKENAPHLGMAIGLGFYRIAWLGIPTVGIAAVLLPYLGFGGPRRDGVHQLVVRVDRQIVAPPRAQGGAGFA